jgi:hypothetical protein
MGIQHAFPDADAARAAGKLFNLHSPAEIATAIELLIDLLDAIGGDPDAEETDAEDAFERSPSTARNSTGAGCALSDPGGVITSEDEPDMCGFVGGDGPGCPISDADTSIDDGPCDDPNMDLELEDQAHPSFGIDQRQALPWEPSNDLRARQPHRDRIRATRCETSPRDFFGMVGREYRLPDDPVVVILPRGQRGKLTRLF